MSQKAASGKEIEATVQEIKSGSGAVERCPECNRVLTNDHCVVHLDVEGKKDLRIKAKLSNGKVVVINGGIAEKLLDIDKEDAHVLPEHDLLRMINGKLKGKKLKATVTDINKEEGLVHAESIDNIGDF